MVASPTWQYGVTDLEICRFGFTDFAICRCGFTDLEICKWGICRCGHRLSNKQVWNMEMWFHRFGNKQMWNKEAWLHRLGNTQNLRSDQSDSQKKTGNTQVLNRLGSRCGICRCSFTDLSFLTPQNKLAFLYQNNQAKIQVILLFFEYYLALGDLLHSIENVHFSLANISRTCMFFLTHYKQTCLLIKYIQGKRCLIKYLKSRFDKFAY